MQTLRISQKKKIQTNKERYCRWLTNAPSTFQRLVTEAMGSYINKFVQVYLDDIMIYSKTWTEHLEHIQKVLNKLKENKLVAKLKKCKWRLEEVQYLGQIISCNKVQANPEQQAKVDKWKALKNARELR